MCNGLRYHDSAPAAPVRRRRHGGGPAECGVSADSCISTRGGDHGGGGGNDRVGDKPKTSPSGGIPLPDAEPSSKRLRAHERLADTTRRYRRRRISEPALAPDSRTLVFTLRETDVPANRGRQDLWSLDLALNWGVNWIFRRFGAA